jgi:hypothetical protein
MSCTERYRMCIWGSMSLELDLYLYAYTIRIKGGIFHVPQIYPHIAFDTPFGGTMQSIVLLFHILHQVDKPYNDFSNTPIRVTDKSPPGIFSQLNLSLQGGSPHP